VIQCKNDHSDKVGYAKKLRDNLLALDSLAVVDFDACGSSFRYGMNNRTAEDAEEFALNIPPTKFYVTENWVLASMPLVGLVMNWNRVVYKFHRRPREGRKADS